MSDCAKRFELLTPIVFITFNRPEATKRVFEKIKEFKPGKLYLVSDAARKHVQGEAEIVDSLRSHLENEIDWECETVKIYASENMGCAKRVSTALDQVFEKEEMAIVLEDDCLPNNSFFEFCQIMLNRYKEDEHVLSVCGCNEIKYDFPDEKDYFFSKKFGCWGWATWKRAWKLFDYNMSGFDIEKNNPIFEKTLFDRRAYWNIMAQFDALAKTDKKFSWAYIFYYYSILNDGYHIYPRCNLIDNIGFNDASTHTQKKPVYYCNECEEIIFPISEHKEVEWEREYDKYYFKMTQRHGWIVRIKQLLGLDINVSVFTLFKHLRRE